MGLSRAEAVNLLHPVFPAVPRPRPVRPAAEIAGQGFRRRGVLLLAAAATQVARTALGPVGYREVGHGPALVLITGFGASMDDWAPYFVNALATRFRVVVFDNAGIGQTAALTAPLSIPEMAAQTSALISALGLGPCYVLGWSMGGLMSNDRMLAGLIHGARLVLYPGAGHGFLFQDSGSFVSELTSFLG